MKYSELCYWFAEVGAMSFISKVPTTVSGCSPEGGSSGSLCSAKTEKQHLPLAVIFDLTVPFSFLAI